jgi:hypothetical protein
MPPDAVAADAPPGAADADDGASPKTRGLWHLLIQEVFGTYIKLGI